MSAPISCWLNASKDPQSATLWLKPMSSDTVITDSVFVNLPTKRQALRLASRIRETFGSHSYTMLLDLEDIRRSKSGSLSISVDFATLKACLAVTERTVQTEADPDEEAFFASLPTGSLSEDTDDTFDWDI